MTIKPLNSVNDVIAAFGGPSAMAEWAGTTDKAVCWWRHRGIPPGVHLRLIIEADRRGWVIGRDTLELEESDAAYLYDKLGWPVHASA